MKFVAEDSVGLLRLEEGKANAIGGAFLATFNDELDRVAASIAAGETRSLVVTGTGPHFCAGLDLPSLIDLDGA